MSQHARPHLQTHSRSTGHSAVAGAAYRLGLRLLDERTGICHDFRKRKLGEGGAHLPCYGIELSNLKKILVKALNLGVDDGFFKEKSKI